MLFFTIWLVTLIGSLYLFQKVSGSLSILRPNLVSIVYYYSLLISSFIGSLLIVLKLDHHYMINRLHDDNFRVIGFFLICYIMVAMPLAMLVVSKLLGFNAQQEFNDYLKKPVVETETGKKEFFYLFSTLAMICLLAVAYTMLKLDKIPILAMFTGSEDLGKLRIEASRNFAGNTLFRNIFAIGFTPVLSLIAYIYFEKTKKLRWTILFGALFIASIVILTYDLQKAPIMFYFIMLILIRIYIGKTVLSWTKVAMLGSLSVGLLIVMYVFIQGVTNPSSFLSYQSGPIARLILAQIAPFYLHLDLFGEIQPFLSGRSLPNFLVSMYDMEHVRSARVVMEHYFPERVEEGIAGVLNTLYAGEAYANFGYNGIILGTLYVGFFIQVLYIGFIRLPKHPVIIVLFIFFTVNIPRVVVGGFADFLFNPFWIMIVCLFGGLLLFIRLKKDFEAYITLAKNKNKLH
ncbi:oligosaccharide repeat unit polymerase [Fictibacillus sp. 7GRE50]|uniref:O-antigen polymerase n=1 Tax=Fictibacillus sp. 7GRE50 TaxID=2745878 RepID=UPI0018CEE494|nr:O-antigen polymerase [Fictibacillus sp. 7GRE50]MBH0164068.1 oligosaccharide repeat unit polymerase [Fictibacillus sp. 7GRE50]